MKERKGKREMEAAKRSRASPLFVRAKIHTLHLCVTQHAPLARWFAAVTHAASCDAVKSDSGFISCFEF
mgnify:CR=1 FL=1